MSREISFWLSLIRVSHPIRKRVFRYQLHKLLWLAYSDYPTGSNQPFLFTLTGKEDSGGVYCFVQSEKKPDWTKADRENKESSIKLNNVLGVKPVQFLLQTGDQLFFRLQACPIKNLFQGREQRGKKVPIVNPKDIDQWFMRRSEHNGFKLLQYEFYNKKTFVRRKEQPNAKEIFLSTCQFDGLLEVEDPQIFRKALTNGIGPKKIFGFGMMMIAYSAPLQ